MASIPELTRSSSLIFTGTVVERGRSSVPDLPARGDLIVVRVDHALRADPVLGDLAGHLITVAAKRPETFEPGQQATFFTNSWIHGRGIAVREVDHMDPSQEKAVATAVAQLPEEHLQDRLSTARAVIVGTVQRVRQLPRVTFERNAALWAVADVHVDAALRGEAKGTVEVYFPTSDHPLWASAPRLRARQRGIFILHAPSTRTPSEVALAAGSLVVTDSADSHLESRRPAIERLLGGRQAKRN